MKCSQALSTPTYLTDIFPSDFRRSRLGPSRVFILFPFIIVAANGPNQFLCFSEGPEACSIFQDLQDLTLSLEKTQALKKHSTEA